MKPVIVKRRVAIYTRKSHEEGLEQDFNSLHAQREGCQAYLLSQRAEGWIPVPDEYDDGGFSGGTLDRPALKRLLADIEAGKVDIVAVYKIDRLSRSLLDFAKLVEVFDRNNVTFVSVTQSFNTTTSMGRLTLNVLLSFAQFEREVTGERIRDKFAASRKKGIWMGGWTPLGYDVVDRRLVVNAAEATLVRRLFSRFAEIKSMTVLAKELASEGVQGKQGRPLDKGALYKLINNRVYRGDAMHKGTAFAGEHEAIVDQNLWNQAHAVLATGPRSRAGTARTRMPALLKGLIYGPTGRALSPSHTRRKGRAYKYYVSQVGLKWGAEACAIKRVPAAPVEAAVVAQLRSLLRVPEIIVATCRGARDQGYAIAEAQVRDALIQFDAVWDALFPAEQARIVALLVERVDVGAEGIEIRLRVQGLQSLLLELRPPSPATPSRAP